MRGGLSRESGWRLFQRSGIGAEDFLAAWTLAAGGNSGPLARQVSQGCGACAPAQATPRYPTRPLLLFALGWPGAGHLYTTAAPQPPCRSSACWCTSCTASSADSTCPAASAQRRWAWGSSGVADSGAHGAAQARAIARPRLGAGSVGLDVSCPCGVVCDAPPVAPNTFHTPQPLPPCQRPTGCWAAC